jgi:pSer/pThr/pTyr-binding forkhead associated (FHA) protein
MKLSLLVQTPGKWEGKVVPITRSEFLIGRDPTCNLRPASVLVSKRHCALLVRGNQVFVKDLNSTNGTFVNDQPIEGESELRDKDVLKVGAAAFRVLIEVPATVDKPTPVPPTKTETSDDEAAAALLLSLQDEENRTPNAPALDRDGVPTGSTVLDTLAPAAAEGNAEPAEKDEKERKEKDKAKAKPSTGDTSTAAKAILDKYIRRPRT